jgi:hypothetical protein
VTGPAVDDLRVEMQGDVGDFHADNNPA